MNRSPRAFERLQDGWLGFYCGLIIGACAMFWIMEAAQ